MSRFSLQGRTAIVTGGARGVGLAFVEGLAEAGCHVAIFDIIEPNPAFHRFAAKYDIKTASYRVDVSNKLSLEKGFEVFQQEWKGALDICVPCAGINRHYEFLEYPFEEHMKILEVNVLGAFATAQLAAKQMVLNGTTKGSIVMVASIASYGAIPAQQSSAYCASKGAVRAMVPAIAKEIAKHGIRINSISPGYVETEMTASFGHLKEAWKSETMNGRLAQPEDLMGTCVFLASDASSYITGQDILVDGGKVKW